MPLVQRGLRRGTPNKSKSESNRADDCNEMKPPRFKVLHIAAGTVIFVLLQLFLSRNRLPRYSRQPETGFHIIQQEVSPEASLLIKLKLAPTTTGSDDKTVISAWGPHDVELVLSSKRCDYPRFWMRLVGDALVGVELQADSRNKRKWTGSFSLPMKGTYRVDTQWYGCTPDQTRWTGLKESIEFKAMDTSDDSIAATPPEDASLFADSAWVAVTTGPGSRPQFVWKRPKHEALPGKIIRIDESAPVVKEGTVRQPDGLYKFHQLGNYELLCFMGSQSASDIRKKFLKLRPYLAGGQRPFKFHYYNVTDMIHPDKEWKIDAKERVRKCKHILFSLDEMQTPVSQSEYKEQITTFVGHLLKLMNDDTFPIWLFTVNEPPMRATNCYTPFRDRTTNHPCNDVLHDLFEAKTFPERVRLLDNTDLSNPHFDENREDILAIIALRVFVFVGKQVSTWRAMGQMGKIDGLHRNGSIEPNVKLVPYEGWATG